MTSILVALVKLVEEELVDLKDVTREDLMTRFELDDNEAWMLEMVTLETTNPEYNTYDVVQEDGKVFLETIQESIHQSFEGDWSDYDKIVIRSYLADIAWGTYQTTKDRA